MPTASTFCFCNLRGNPPWQPLEVRQLAQGQMDPRWRGGEGRLRGGKAPPAPSPPYHPWSGVWVLSWGPLSLGSRTTPATLLTEKRTAAWFLVQRTQGALFSAGVSSSACRRNALLVPWRAAERSPSRCEQPGSQRWHWEITTHSSTRSPRLGLTDSSFPTSSPQKPVQTRCVPLERPRLPERSATCQAQAGSPFLELLELREHHSDGQSKLLGHAMFVCKEMGCLCLFKGY